jgi:hypothetical protein
MHNILNVRHAQPAHGTMEIMNHAKNVQLELIPLVVHQVAQTV